MNITPLINMYAEQYTLGALLIDNSAIEKIGLTAADFSDTRHKIIFSTIKHLIDEHGNGAADVFTVSDEIISLGKLRREEIADYIVDLQQDTPSAANIKRYADRVKEYAIRRELSVIGNNLVSGCYDTAAAVNITFDTIQSKLDSVAEKQSDKKTFSKFNEVLSRLMPKIEEKRKNPKDITGLETGFIDFDKITHGLQAGDLIIVGGRPSMGKTAFAVNIAENVALKGANIAIFSLEMSDEQLSQRMISSVGSIEHDLLQTGRLVGQAYENYINAVSKLSDIAIDIYDKGYLTVSEIIALCRNLTKKQAVDLIVIDYLQLMSGENKNNNNYNRNLEISDITRRLKGLAKELKVPIILISQINRDNTKRADKRPTMADLRDSGSIEQDADLILLIHREDYYHKDERGYIPTGRADLIIEKNRNGATGVVELAFFGKFTCFRNLAY